MIRQRLTSCTLIGPGGTARSGTHEVKGCLLQSVRDKDGAAGVSAWRAGTSPGNICTALASFLAGCVGRLVSLCPRYRTSPRRHNSSVVVGLVMAPILPVHNKGAWLRKSMARVLFAPFQYPLYSA